MTETEIIAKYRATEEAHNEASRELKEHFLPLVKAALESGNMAEAKALSRRCPDSVAKVFIWDLIRTHNQNT